MVTQIDVLKSPFLANGNFKVQIQQIICIFTAAKNQTSNFADTPFEPD